MAMERRSRRTKKPVRYFGEERGSDEDSEDDFASAPPPKKPRDDCKGTAAHAKGQPRQEKPGKCATTGVVVQNNKTKTRLSREEKQFNRELQRVIEVSSPQLVAPGLVAVGDDKGRARGRESEEESKGVHSSTDGEQLNQLVGESDKENDSDFRVDDEDSDSVSSCPEDASDSDFSASPSPKPKTKGRKCVQPRKVQPKNTASVVKTTGSMKGGVASTGSKQPMHRGPTRGAKPPVTPRSKGSNQPSSLTMATPTATSRSSLPGSGAGPPGLGVGRAPKWTPPARVSPGGDGTKTNSPSVTGSSGLRLGLSRNARIKPLHTKTSLPSV